MLDKIKAYLANSIKIGVTTSASDDSKNFPENEFTSDQKSEKTVILYPYGYHANMDKGALSLLLSIQGDLANKVAIGGYTEYRPTLVAGEVAVFNPKTEKEIILKANGDLVTTVNKLSISNDSEELVDLLVQLVTACEAITTTTISGPTPTNNKVTFTDLKTKLTTFKV